MRHFLSVISLAFLALFFSQGHCDFSEKDRNRILYTSQKSVPDALKLYLDSLDSQQHHDFSILRALGERGLKQSLLSSEASIRKGAIIGASLSSSAEALDILSLAMETEDPFEQLLVLSAISSHLSTTTDELLFKAMNSPYPIIRLEAAYRLAGLKNTKVIDYLHTFIHQLPEQVQTLSATIFLKLDTEEANAYIHELLGSKQSSIRNAIAVLIGDCQKKCFLSALRSLATSALPSDQEGAVYALGMLKDGSSYPLIKNLLKKNNPDIALAAAQALIMIGAGEESSRIIKEQIQEELPRAIYTARWLPRQDGIPLLLPIFLHTNNEEAKLSAALALIQLKCPHPKLLDFLTNWLETPFHGRVIVPSFSKGRATQSWKYAQILLPSNPNERNKALSSIQAIEEHILSFLLQLPEEDYLPYVERILHSPKTKLVAKTIHFLSQVGNEHSLELISAVSNLPGEPVIRAYADLALYNMTKEPEKKHALHRHVKNLIKETLLLVDMEKPHPNPDSTYLRYQITPEMRSQLMLDILEALVASKSPADIRLLIDLMIETKAPNFPILSGLLMRIVE